MSIAAGARLGPYEIVAPIGAGGMGVTRTQYDVTADGRFLINVAASNAPQPPVTVVQNWTAKLSRNQ